MFKSILILKVVLLCFIPCLLVLTLVFNFLTTRITSNIFYATTATVSAKYTTPLTPAGWTFGIWGIIYLCQLLMSSYMITSFFIGVDKFKLFTYDYVFPLPFLVLYLINLILNLAWIFIFDRSYVNINLLPLSAFTLILISITLYICIGIISYNIKNGIEDRFYSNRRPMLVVDYIVILNGLGIYASWTSISQCLNIAISLIHYSKVDIYISSNIGISILLVAIIGYLIIDITLLDNYTRYLIIPYIVIAYYIGGLINKNYNYGNYEKSYVILETIAVFTIIIKLSYTIIRSVKNPFALSGYKVTA